MNLIVIQQVALENALVAPEKRLKIEKCNARIKFIKRQREEPYQVTLDVLKLSPCYPAFLFTAEVPEILHICPRLPNQDFVEPPSEEEMVPFIKELGYTGKCDMISEIHTYHMHQPWRIFVAIINRCIFRSHPDLIGSGRQELKSCGFVSKTQDYQKYGALMPEEMINQAIKDSKAYKTYIAFATGQATPKKNDDEEEEYEEEYVLTPDNYEFTDDDEEYEDLYKDVNV
ncbi:hypothetical protein Tco_0730763, partial [Tanacetum coccineum]